MILFQIIGEGCSLFNLNGEEDFLLECGRKVVNQVKDASNLETMSPSGEVTRKFSTALEPAALNQRLNGVSKAANGVAWLEGYLPALLEI